jgi:hypothetical protein
MVIIANPISDGLWINGLRQDEDAMIHRQIPSCINKALFYEYRGCPMLSWTFQELSI